MATLDKRLSDLEGKQSSAGLSGMTAEQLDAQLGTLTPGTLEWFRVMLTSIRRRGSKLPISTIR